MKWIDIGFRIAPLIISAVTTVERIFTSDANKEDKAMALLEEMLPTVEAILARDLLNDAKVNEAAREAMRAIVAFQNALAAAKAAKS